MGAPYRLWIGLDHSHTPFGTWWPDWLTLEDDDGGAELSVEEAAEILNQDHRLSIVLPSMGGKHLVRDERGHWSVEEYADEDPDRPEFWEDRWMRADHNAAL